MKRLALTLVTTSALFSAYHVHAEEKIAVLSTQDLVNVCNPPSSPESRSFCIGYTTAIYDTYLATRHPQRAKPYICVKQPAPTRDEVIGEFIKFGQSRQEIADKPATGVFLGFLASRFPCAKK